MAFRKFTSPRAGFSVKYDEPHLRFTKHHIIINDKAKEQIGGAFNYVLLFFDDETDSVGLWFWKERVMDAYSIGGGNKNNKHCFLINGTRFIEKFGIRKKMEEIGRDSFPLVRDEEEKNYYIAALKK